MTIAADDPTTAPIPPAGETIPPTAETTTPAGALKAAERPIHLAKCAECANAVTYQPSASGAGFTLIDPPPDALFGVGEHGRPVCPNGHGEMAIADDRLMPATEAIGQVAEQLGATTPRLPFPAPPFHYANALHAIFGKQHEISDLERSHTRAKEEAKDAKDDLDAAYEQLGKMIIDFERNEQDRKHEQERREKLAREGRPDGLVRCAWEGSHPDEPCPLCVDTVPIVVERIFGGRPLAARDAVGHLDDVDRFLVGLEVEEVLEALADVGIHVEAPAVLAWTSDERMAVVLWADAEQAHDDDASVIVPDRPAVLGTAHVAAEYEDGQAVQACKVCGSVLLRFGDAEIDDAQPWATGMLVGIDCPGAAAAEGQHYPDTSKPKKAAPRKKAEPKPTGAKAKKGGR